MINKMTLKVLELFRNAILKFFIRHYLLTDVYSIANYDATLGIRQCTGQRSTINNAHIICAMLHAPLLSHDKRSTFLPMAIWTLSISQRGLMSKRNVHTYGCGARVNCPVPVYYVTQCGLVLSRFLQRCL